MSDTKLKLLIIKKFNLIILIIILLNQVQNLNGQNSNSWMDNQTVISTQTKQGILGSTTYTPNQTLGPSGVTIGAYDTSGAATPTAPTGFVADTAAASYISGIAATPAAPAGTPSAPGTPGATTPGAPGVASATKSTGPITTKVADLVKITPVNVAENLCAAVAIIGNISGCDSTTDTTVKPATGSVVPVGQQGPGKLGAPAPAPTVPGAPKTNAPLSFTPFAGPKV